jgi:hypothetical protein
MHDIGEEEKTNLSGNKNKNGRTPSFSTIITVVKFLRIIKSYQ